MVVPVLGSGVVVCPEVRAGRTGTTETDDTQEEPVSLQDPGPDTVAVLTPTVVRSRGDRRGPFSSLPPSLSVGRGRRGSRETTGHPGEGHGTLDSGKGRGTTVLPVSDDPDTTGGPLPKTRTPREADTGSDR